tara:strand:- start:2101 stop:3156 length:1056 start_codon:yes stop_codon:yes gene_type:complete
VIRKGEMAHLRKHFGKWQAVIQKKKIRVAKSFTNKSDARKWSHKVEALIETGSYFGVMETEKLNEIKVNELLDVYFDSFKRKTKHIKRFTYEVGFLKRQKLSNLFLSQLKPKVIAEFRDQQLTLGKSGSTVNKYIGLISRAINHGKRELDIPVTYNPCSLVQKVKETQKINRYCTDEEYSYLLELAKTVYPKSNRSKKTKPLYFMQQIIIFARETLMRQGELLRLKKRDIDFTKGTATILETKNNKPVKIGLSPKAIEVLQQLPSTIDGRYFPVKDRREFDSYWRVLIKAANIDIAFHTLRHLGATDLIKSGWSLAEVQAQGNWKTLKALQRYLDIQAEYLAKKLKFKREA